MGLEEGALIQKVSSPNSFFREEKNNG